MRTIAVILFSLLLAGAVKARPAILPHACASLIQSTAPSWKTLVPDREVVDWAEKKGLNPVVASGDFDGDRTVDWATLGTIDGKTRIVLCLTKTAGRSIVITEDSGCSDYVYTIRRETRVPNRDNGSEETLRNDAVATSCFEKSGRVFIYEGGAFRTFFNSD
jgi:hypothetical protein